MGRRNANKNVLGAVRAFEELGATVLQIKNNGKHNGLRIETAKGVRFWFQVSGGRIDDFKQKGWVRQALHRADARVKHNASQNRR